MNLNRLKRASVFGLAAATLASTLGMGAAPATAQSANTPDGAPALTMVTPKLTAGLTPTVKPGQILSGHSEGSSDGIAIHLENPSTSGQSNTQSFTITAPTGTHWDSGQVNYAAREGFTGHWTRGALDCDLSADQTVIDCTDVNLVLHGTLGHGQSGATWLEPVLAGDDPMYARGLIEDGDITFGEGLVVTPGTSGNFSYIADTPNFVAQTDSIDPASRTARISGTGYPGATVEINSTQNVPVDRDGAWNAVVTDLPFGDSSILVEEFLTQDGIPTKTAEQALAVTITIGAVTAAGAFDADPARRATISGTAHPGATVEVRDAEDGVIATTAASLTTGRYSVEVTAPDAGGVYATSVNQIIAGERNGSVRIDLDYGAAVSITTPAQDAIHEGGPVSMSGRGDPGARITVRQQGTSDIIGSTTVLVSGSWNLKTTALDDREAVLEVTQQSRGDNTTRALVTINPGASTTDPLVVEAPADGSTVVAPDNLVDFSGTAEPGARVVVKAGNGRVVIDTTADASGRWAARGLLGHQWYQLTTEYTAPDQAMVGGSLAVTVKAAEGVSRPFAVTTPADDTTVVAPDNLVTFAGTGTTDATVVIKASNGRTVVETTVDDFGTWRATGFLAHQWYELDTFTVVDGVTTTGKTHVTVRATAGVTQPFSITAPADDATVVAPGNLVQFSGTGTTDSTVVITAGNGRTVIETTVDEAGRWSATGFLAHQRYELDTFNVVDGTTTSGKTRVTVLAAAESAE